jgi:hypothetical protein
MWEPKLGLEYESVSIPFQSLREELIAEFQPDGTV